MTLILGAASLALPFNAASAHEQAIGLTEVSFIAPETASASCLEQTCRVEVAHRYSIHDAESTLMHVLGARADLVGDADAQRKFADYVASQFTLTDAATGEAIALTLLGGEVEPGVHDGRHELGVGVVGEQGIEGDVVTPRRQHRRGERSVGIRHHDRRCVVGRSRSPRPPHQVRRLVDAEGRVTGANATEDLDHVGDGRWTGDPAAGGVHRRNGARSR